MTKQDSATVTAQATANPGCLFCAALSSRGVLPMPFDDSTLVVYIGDTQIVLVRTEKREVLVAPTEHVDYLSKLSPWSFARMLSTLRRVSLVMFGEEEGIAVESAEQLAGSYGHVCTRIFSRFDDHLGWPVDEPAELARRLAYALDT